jgi:hypothetical protein
MEGLLLQLINPMSECMDVGFISNCSQFRKSDLNSFYFNHLFTLLSNWSKWLRTASGSPWSDFGHAVPCLEQDWVKNEQYAAAWDCCRSLKLLLHHSLSSVWVQQNMLQCATGNSWSVLGHMLCLFWSRLGWKWALCISMRLLWEPENQLWAHPVLQHHSLSSVYSTKDVTMCNWQFMVCLGSCCDSFIALPTSQWVVVWSATSALWVLSPVSG